MDFIPPFRTDAELAKLRAEATKIPLEEKQRLAAQILARMPLEERERAAAFVLRQLKEIADEQQ